MVQAVFGAFVQRVNGNMDEVNPQPDDVWFLKGGACTYPCIMMAHDFR